MLVPHDPASEEASVGGTLTWKERGDGHWIARGLGGYYELVPVSEGGWRTWWMGSNQTPVDLGRYPTLGGAMASASRHGDVPVRHAAEDCDHTHPSSVPSAPCPDPGAHKVAVAQRVTAIEAERVLVAGESALQWQKKTFHSHNIRTGRSARAPSDVWFATVSRRGDYEDEYAIWHHDRKGRYDLQFVSTHRDRDDVVRIGKYVTLAQAKAAAERDWSKRREKKAQAPRRRRK